MEQNELRTYHRRSVTRESGYHTCDDTTGGECLVKFADRYICQKHVESFSFHRDSIELVELFENGISTIAFGGFIFSNKKATISFEIGYTYEGNRYEFTDCLPEYEIEEKSWKNVGFHIEQTLNIASAISDISIIMRIISVHRRHPWHTSLHIDLHLIQNNQKQTIIITSHRP